jgi:hypothetical protein
MALDEPLPNTHVVEPKAKKKYKIKKEKQGCCCARVNNSSLDHVGEELYDEKVQSLRNNVEETMKPPPQKTKKKR